MLVVDSILGNAYHENSLSQKIEDAKQHQTLKRLFLSRPQMEKSRLRAETEDGTEIGLSLEPGTVLHNGDVLEINSHLIIIHQLPEKIIRVTINENHWSTNLLVHLVILLETGIDQFQLHLTVVSCSLFMMRMK